MQERYRKALDREAAAVTRAETGNRNAALHTAAFRLGRLYVAEGRLDEDEVVAALLEACAENGLLAADGRLVCKLTIREGLRAGELIASLLSERLRSRPRRLPLRSALRLALEERRPRCGSTARPSAIRDQSR